MKIVNMTPHPLNIRTVDGTFVTVPAPSKEEVEANPNLIARCASERKAVAVVDGIELYETTFGAPSALPEPAQDTIFVVSSLYLAGLRAHGQDRTDMYVPGEAIRGEDGKQIGCGCPAVRPQGGKCPRWPGGKSGNYQNPARTSRLEKNYGYV